MYDSLNKIGLKAVLEAIKGKIPTSLPANGGNADTVDGKHAENFIYPRAMLSNVDLNTILYPCSALIYGDCTNIPPVESWGTLLCYSGGTGSHVQLWATATDSSMFKRHYDGVKWSDWEEISTTPIKKISFPSVATNVGGGGVLFFSDFGTPIVIACTSRTDTQCTPFLADSDSRKLWLVLAKDCTTLDPIPVGSYSFDVWYI